MTPSERRAAELASQGKSNREIAAQMQTTEGSVKQTLYRLYSREGISSRVELTLRMRAEEK